MMDNYRKFVSKMGRNKAVLYTTALALVLTLTFTGLYEIIMYKLGFGVKPLTAVIITFAVTLTVTPLLSWNFVGVFLRLHNLEEEIRSIAQYDQLTGLLSRHEFFDRAKMITSLCIREKIDFTVALMDLDNFKKVNDEFGHLAGDELLANLGSEIKKTIRENDLACRFGGDEFIFLLPNVTMKNFLPVQGRLENIIGKISSTIKSRAEIGISLGLASYTNVVYSGLDSMIAAADFALYKAKKDPHSNIHIFSEEDASLLFSDNDN